MLEQKIKALVPPGVPTVIGDLPSTASNIVAIRLFDGGANDAYFGTDTVFHPVVKFVARHASYETMRSWIDSIKEKFQHYHDDYFMSVHMVGYPMYLGRGELKLHEMQVTFRIEVKE